MESILYTLAPTLYKGPMKAVISTRIPVLTFLILTTSLGACARLKPPVSKGFARGPAKPAGVIGVSLLQEGLKIGFKGVDAGRMYLLMAIQSESSTNDESTSFVRRMKAGRDFQCAAVSDDFICELTLTVAGGVVPVRDPAKVVRAAPEMEQREYRDEWISIAPPEQPGKVRLAWVGAPAKAVFDALSIPAASGRKAGEKVECTERAGVSASDPKTFECALLLDLQSGSIEKPGAAAGSDPE